MNAEPQTDVQDAVSEALVLRVEELGVTRAGAPRPVLARLSLTLRRGEALVLLGESGCGKEALVRVLAGLPERGEQISGTLAFGDGIPRRAGRRLHGAPRTAYLPGPLSQPLSPHASVLSQLVRILARRLGLPRASARAELELALGRMPDAPAPAALGARPGELEPSLIAWGLFAVTFAQAPELVLADHPLAGLPPLALRALANALKTEQIRLGFSLVYAATGTEVAHTLGARMLVMRHGRVVEEGPVGRLSGPQAHAYTRTLFRDWAAPEGPARNAGRGEPALQVSGFESPRRAEAPRAPREFLNFELRRGASLALVGERGSGRRRLVRQLIGLERPKAGRVVLDAVDTGILSEAMLTRLRRRIAYITGDDDALDPRMTIWDTVGEPLRAHLGLPRDVVAGYREAALKRVGLASLPGTLPLASLSRFDKRRLQIARAIVTAPLLAILDEPLLGLDAFAQSVMRDLLHTFRAEEGPAVLLVTSDFAVARALAEQVFVFEDGRVVERGAVADVVRAPREGATRRLIEAVSGPAPRGVP